MKIAVFASHNGSDLQAIIDACQNGMLNATVEAVISNNSDSKALERAHKANISSYHISAKTCGNESNTDAPILYILQKHQIDLVFLAGYLKKIGDQTLRQYHNRIFNIHPALLPKYGGKGMYGMQVHAAVIHAGESTSGVTIHRVNEEYDAGEIVAQKMIPVSKSDTPESLAKKVLQYEHLFLVDFLKDIVNGSIPLG
ncbi:MAG: phosphoribosylglycinamide formyltransferase [Oscillospiraceae bacterium]|jgi:phosphoribosylglycinamide formyltransferase-1|nr:phosphoribosylglycinamide formyltransferase [Oscillospiraceae bacterium]